MDENNGYVPGNQQEPQPQSEQWMPAPGYMPPMQSEYEGRPIDAHTAPSEDSTPDVPEEDITNTKEYKRYSKARVRRKIMKRVLIASAITLTVAAGALLGVAKYIHKHTEATYAAVAATCTSTGLTEGKYCSVCQEALVKQTEIPALSHDIVNHNSQSATCTAIGWGDYETCNRCDYTTYSEIGIINCIESEWIIDEAATEAENGLKHTECTMCHTRMREEIIPATASLGLAYAVNDDGVSCTITGMGRCKDKDVCIPSSIDGYSVTSIGSYAFNHCSSLTSVTIPDSVTSISRGTFYYCSSLTNVTIPDSVTSIGEMAFDSCTSLTSVTIPDSVTSIGNQAFYRCASLTSFTIPNGITSIGEWTFCACSSLTSVTIPDGVTSIGSDAFRSCTSLTSVTIPDSVTSIGDGAFHSCSSLTNVTIPNGITSIEEWTFYNCSSLTSVTIPYSVTSIRQDALSGCTSLASIHYNGTKAQWNAISKGYDWNSGTGRYTIYCIDGNISK